MKTVWIPGRFQPPTVGHRALIQRALDEGAHVVILIRDTEIGVRNPYTAEYRAQILREWFGEQVDICVVPDRDCDLEIWAGRKVGWKYREVKMPENIERISATAIREGLRRAGAI